MNQLTAFCRLSADRFVGATGLLAIRFFGVLFAVTLIVGVSLYSTAMGDAILHARLASDAGNQDLSIGNTTRPLSNATYVKLDRYISDQVGRDLGLPLLDRRVHAYTATVPTYRQRGQRAAPLEDLALHYYAQFSAHVHVLAGSLTIPEPARGTPWPIAISRYTAQSLSLRLGDRLVYAQAPGGGVSPPLAVVAVYEPNNDASQFWDINAAQPRYRSLVALRLSNFLAVAARTRPFNADYFWRYRTDVAALHLADAPALLDRLQRISGKLAALAPGTGVLTTLGLSVGGFLDQYSLLPVLLFILVAPIALLVLYAVAVTTTLALDRQADEIALMRSRGATRRQIGTLYALEGLMIGLVATALGPLLGLPLGRLIGNASGWLRFTGGLPYDLRLSPSTYLLAAAVAVLGLLAGFIPAIGLSRRSLMALKLDQARSARRPLWQRLFLDVVIMACSLYGLAVLARQGTITSGTVGAAIVQDPVSVLAPLLFVVAIALFSSRLLPGVAALVVRLARRYAAPPARMALQGVRRAPRQPMQLVQLSALTVALGVVAATIAGVEASNLSDQQLYTAGAPLRLREYNAVQKQYQTLPLADHLRLPGVRAATPALRFETSSDSVNVTDNGTAVTVLGIDPRTAAAVMWFRADFATQPFSRLLALLTRSGPNAIVSDAFVAATGLHGGDSFSVTLANGQTVSARVAATAHYFPTLDPAAAPFVVLNLAYLQHASHSSASSEVWLATAPSQAIVDRLLRITRDWPRQIFAEQGLTPAFSAEDAPLTAGIYGVVSLGFLSALALALLGFVAYAYLSLQRRLREFAIVRALGFSAGQTQRWLLYEHFFVLGMGIGSGLVAGILATRLFLPYMPVTAATTPPFLVVVPWGAIAEFVLTILLVFALLLSAHVALLLRLQLSRVLRLGEG